MQCQQHSPSTLQSDATVQADYAFYNATWQWKAEVSNKNNQYRRSAANATYAPTAEEHSHYNFNQFHYFNQFNNHILTAREYSLS